MTSRARFLLATSSLILAMQSPSSGLAQTRSNTVPKKNSKTSVVAKTAASERKRANLDNGLQPLVTPTGGSVAVVQPGGSLSASSTAAGTMPSTNQMRPIPTGGAVGTVTGDGSPLILGFKPTPTPTPTPAPPKENMGAQMAAAALGALASALGGGGNNNKDSSRNQRPSGGSGSPSGDVDSEPAPRNSGTRPSSSEPAAPTEPAAPRTADEPAAPAAPTGRDPAPAPRAPGDPAEKPPKVEPAASPPSEECKKAKRKGPGGRFQLPVANPEIYGCNMKQAPKAKGGSAPVFPLSTSAASTPYLLETVIYTEKQEPVYPVAEGKLFSVQCFPLKGNQKTCTIVIEHERCPEPSTANKCKSFYKSLVLDSAKARELQDKKGQSITPCDSIGQSDGSPAASSSDGDRPLRKNFMMFGITAGTDGREEPLKPLVDYDGWDQVKREPSMTGNCSDNLTRHQRHLMEHRTRQPLATPPSNDGGVR